MFAGVVDTEVGLVSGPDVLDQLGRIEP